MTRTSHDTLERLCDEALVAGLPDSLKRAIDLGLDEGCSDSGILAVARRAAGRDSLTYLGVEAYLRSRQEAQSA